MARGQLSRAGPSLSTEYKCQQISKERPHREQGLVRVGRVAFHLQAGVGQRRAAPAQATLMSTQKDTHVPYPMCTPHTHIRRNRHRAPTTPKQKSRLIEYGSALFCRGGHRCVASFWPGASSSCWIDAPRWAYAGWRRAAMHSNVCRCVSICTDCRRWHAAGSSAAGGRHGRLTTTQHGALPRRDAWRLARFLLGSISVSGRRDKYRREPRRLTTPPTALQRQTTDALVKDASSCPSTSLSLPPLEPYHPSLSTWPLTLN